VNAIPPDMYKRQLPNIVAHLHNKGITGVHGDEVKKLRWWLARVRKQVNQSVELALRNTFGELLQIAQHHTRAKLEERQVFHQHAVYALPGAQATPPTEAEFTAWTAAVARREEDALASTNSRKLSRQVRKELKKMEQDERPKGRVRIVFSSENLLLNAYRQQCSGKPAMLCVDYTHRLVFEKYNVCVMGNVDPTQHFHLVALAMTSDESEDTHKHVFELVRDEVNSIVQARSVSKTPI